MFSTAGIIFVATPGLLLLLLQLAAVAKAKWDGIVVTEGVAHPIALFFLSSETAAGYKAVVFSLDPQLPDATYDMERDFEHGWILHGVTPEMALLFNGTPRRGGERTGNTYEWVDSTQVQVEFVGEKKVVPLPTNPQQAQQHGGNPQPQHQYPPCPVNVEARLPSGPIFQIVVDISLKPLVEHPGGGVVTTEGNPPQIVGHFTWKAAKGSVHDRMVEVTSTSDSLPSRAYKVKLDPKHGWILQEPTEIYVLVPNGELYRKRAGGGVQHASGGHIENVEHEVIGTYEWDRRELGYVKLFFKGENPAEAGEQSGVGYIYEVGGMDSPPDQWYIMVPFTLKPKAPPINVRIVVGANGGTMLFD